MKGIAFVFFAAAAVCVTAGMVWGLQMSISQAHMLSPAHAHLNLVGWVTLGLFGLYYHVTPHAAATRLARVHLVLALIGAATMAPGIALAILGRGEILAVIGSLATFASMLVFLYTVLRQGLGERRAVSSSYATPAE